MYISDARTNVKFDGRTYAEKIDKLSAATRRKEKAATRRASRDCVNRVAPGRNATSELYHSVSGFVKPLFITSLAILTIYAVISAASVKAPELIPIEHKVTYGDTLWGIAKEYKPDCMTMDEYMGWVYDHNKDGLIYPGDVVTVGRLND